MENGKPSHNKRRRQAVVLGGGVAGMTAAHELSERGFQVHVLEPNADPFRPGQPQVGGMARTQWSRIPWEHRRRKPRNHNRCDEDAEGASAISEDTPRHLRGLTPNDKSRIGDLLALLGSPNDSEDPDARTKEEQEKLLTKIIRQQFPPTRDLKLFGTPYGWDSQFEIARPELTFKPGQWTYHDKDEALDRFSTELAAYLLESQRSQALVHNGHRSRHPRHAFEVIYIDAVAIGTELARLDPGIQTHDANLRRQFKNEFNRTFRPSNGEIDFDRGWIQDPQIFDEDPNEHIEIPFEKWFSMGILRARLAELLSQLRCEQIATKLREKLDKVDGFSEVFDVFYDREPRKDGREKLFISLVLRPLGFIHQEDVLRRGQGNGYVSLSLQENILPGEHGYRFFPRFYHHIFDTMRRIPLLEKVQLTPQQVQSNLKGVHEGLSPRIQQTKYRYKDSSRSVFDNLVPLTHQAIARRDTKRPHVLTRKAGLMESGAEVLAKMQEATGFTESDIHLTNYYILKLMTSSRARREELEALTWSEFIQLDERYSEVFRESLDNWPRALVGLSARHGDARTYGEITTQLLIDQLLPGDFRDATLNGPTSTAWLDRWREYLELKQDVTFHLAKLNKICLTKTEQSYTLSLVCESGCGLPDKLKPAAYTFAQEDSPSDTDAPRASRMRGQRIHYEAPEPRIAELVEEAHYIVVALPVEQLCKISHDFAVDARELLAKDISAKDVECMLTEAAPTLMRLSGLFSECELRPFLEKDSEGGEPAKPSPAGQRLRDFSGIQFYLETDFQFFRGHTYFWNSEWGLSSISQAQFRQDRADARDGFRGLISVDIGIWDKKYQLAEERAAGLEGLTAWECTDEQLALRVWDQIRRAVASPGDADRPPLELPAPEWFHIDSSIRRRPKTKASSEQGGHHEILRGNHNYEPRRNKTPYMVDTPAGWRARPGVPGAYTLDFGKLAFCGTYMKTWTRLPSMESANESARHAVNAILKSVKEKNPDRGRKLGSYCETWPLDERELPVLRQLRAIDEGLMARGLPHMLDILGVEKHLSAWMAGQAGGGTKSLGAFLEHLTSGDRSAAGQMLAPLQALVSIWKSLPR